MAVELWSPLALAKQQVHTSRDQTTCLTTDTPSTFACTMSSSTAADPAALAATRQSSKTAPPTPSRDGFHLVPSHPVVYDVDMSGDFTDITYHVSTIDCCARIAFDRPQVLHAFRPTTINEVRRALELAQDDTRVGGKRT